MFLVWLCFWVLLDVILSMLIRFNATALLERLRNKRLVFVGDSLNRGQWVSMVCLVESVVPPSLKFMHTLANGSLNIFKAIVSLHSHHINTSSFSIFPCKYICCSCCQMLIAAYLKWLIKEYNATIEFYWAPLLVESNSDDPVNHRVPERTVRIKAIEKHAKYWTDADILIFNTYLWWRRPVMNVL